MTPPAEPSSSSKIQLFFTVAPLGEGQSLRTVSVRAAYSQSVGDVVRAAAEEALGDGGNGDGNVSPANNDPPRRRRRLAAFWHGAQIDLDDSAQTVETIGWHTGFGIKCYELPPLALEGAEDGGNDADWARVQAQVDFFPPVERVLPAVVGKPPRLVLREVSGDAAIKLVQAQAREQRAAARGRTGP
jgi:hypothetical protein